MLRCTAHGVLHLCMYMYMYASTLCTKFPRPFIPYLHFTFTRPVPFEILLGIGLRLGSGGIADNQWVGLDQLVLLLLR